MLKKILSVILVLTLLLSLSGCWIILGPTRHTDGDTSTTTTTTEEISPSATSTTLDVFLDQLDYQIEEVIDDGERYVLMQCTNNSSYTISYFNLSFIEPESVTEEQRQAFYSDLKENNEFDDEEISDLEDEQISMHAETRKLLPSGESNDKIQLYYFDGYVSMNNIDHYNLLEPDIATISYVKDRKIYTEYYDFQTGKYSTDDDIEDAYVWGKTSALADLVSKPDTEVCKVDFDRDDVFWFTAYGYSIDDYNNYVDDCIAKGFIVDADSFDNSYFAYDENGNRISIYYTDDDASFSVEVEAATVTTEETTTTQEEEPTETPNEQTEHSYDSQDISDEAIESIETYGDYMNVYTAIVVAYLDSYEEALKGTILYDEDTLESMKAGIDEELQDLEDDYGSMKSMKLVGKETYVEFLKTYRDELMQLVDTYAEILN